MICRFFRKFKLDHRSLTSQWSFWLAVAAPIALFLFFGSFSWAGKVFRFDQEGFDEFIRISKLPLGFLATIIPSVAVVSSMHRSIQTAEQIKHAEEKKNEEKELRLSEAAEECLKKAYELISDGNGETIRGAIVWKNSANFLIEFHRKKENLRIPGIVEKLEVEEDYWRAKFEALLGSLKFKEDVVYMNAEPAVIFIIAEFSTWRRSRKDIVPYELSKEEFLKTLSKLGGNKAIREYLELYEQKILLRHLSAAVSMKASYPRPHEMVEDENWSVGTNDPEIIGARERREASSNET